jgi:hypothetical protein
MNENYDDNSRELSRMENARRLAFLNNRRMWREYPEFVEKYIRLSYYLLTKRREITGDQFKLFCEHKGLTLPLKPNGDKEEHNFWTGGPTMLKGLGFIEFLKYVTPIAGHNHMNHVVLWKSLVYGKDPILKLFDEE